MRFSIIDRLFGCVCFELWGSFPEDFLNLAISEGIELWNLKREKDTLFATARVWQIKRIKLLAEKSGLVFTEKQETGILKKIKSYRLRYGLLVGAVLLCVFVFVMSQFLWKIEISGCENIDEKKLCDKLCEYDIKIGGYAKRKDLDDLQLKLLRDFSDLAFISINIKGSYAKIEVTERKIPPDIIDQYDPCNIVASKGGQIISVKTYSGVTLCKKGQNVEKGELLVSGIFDSKYVGFRMVHAKAEILALAKEEITVEKYYEYEGFERTGKKENYYTFNFLGLSLTLPFGKCSFENYDEENDKKMLKVGEDFYLPMSFERTTYYETERVKLKRTPEEAEKEAVFSTEEQFRVFKSENDVKDFNVSIVKDSKKVAVTYHCTVIKDIAAEKEIFRN